MEFANPKSINSKIFYTIILATVLTGTSLSIYPVFMMINSDEGYFEKINMEETKETTNVLNQIKNIGSGIITLYGGYQLVNEILELDIDIPNWKPLTGFFDNPSDMTPPDLSEFDKIFEDSTKDDTSMNSKTPIIKVPLAVYGYILDDGNEILKNPGIDLRESTMLSNQCLKQFESESYLNSLNCYLKLLEKDPDNPILLNNIGVQFVILNQPNDALNYFNQAYEIDSNYDNYRVLHNLAITNAMFGDEVISQKYYLLALEKNHSFFSKDLENFFNDYKKIKNKNIDFDQLDYSLGFAKVHREI